MSRPAVFLDRDGVLNDLVLYPDTQAWESPRTPDEVKLLHGVLPALRRLQEKGFPLFLVSNQPNLAKGKSTFEDLVAVHARLESLLAEGEVFLGGAYYCLHHPQARLTDLRVTCPCRKPGPGLLQMASRAHGLDLTRSWMIGDLDSDVECGQRAGCRTVLIPNPVSSAPHWFCRPDRVLPDLVQFAYSAEVVCQ